MIYRLASFSLPLHKFCLLFLIRFLSSISLLETFVSLHLPVKRSSLGKDLNDVGFITHTDLFDEKATFPLSN